jgi:hypothetical protein
VITFTGTGGQWPGTWPEPLSITGGTSYLNDRAYVIAWQSAPAPRRHFERHRESRHRRRFALRPLVVLEPDAARAPSVPLLVAAAVLRRRTCSRAPT